MSANIIMYCLAGDFSQFFSQLSSQKHFSQLGISRECPFLLTSVPEHCQKFMLLKIYKTSLPFGGSRRLFNLWPESQYFPSVLYGLKSTKPKSLSPYDPQEMFNFPLGHIMQEFYSQPNEQKGVSCSL